MVRFSRLATRRKGLSHHARARVCFVVFSTVFSFSCGLAVAVLVTFGVPLACCVGCVVLRCRTTTRARCASSRSTTPIVASGLASVDFGYAQQLATPLLTRLALCTCHTCCLAARVPAGIFPLFFFFFSSFIPPVRREPVLAPRSQSGGRAAIIQPCIVVTPFIHRRALHVDSLVFLPSPSRRCACFAGIRSTKLEISSAPRAGKSTTRASSICRRWTQTSTCGSLCACGSCARGWKRRCRRAQAGLSVGAPSGRATCVLKSCLSLHRLPLLPQLHLVFASSCIVSL
jgi:hypothetical protein